MQCVSCRQTISMRFFFALFVISISLVLFIVSAFAVAIFRLHLPFLWSCIVSSFSLSLAVQWIENLFRILLTFLLKNLLCVEFLSKLGPNLSVHFSRNLVILALIRGSRAWRLGECWGGALGGRSVWLWGSGAPEEGRGVGGGVLEGRRALAGQGAVALLAPGCREKLKGIMKTCKKGRAYKN